MFIKCGIINNIIWLMHSGRTSLEYLHVLRIFMKTDIIGKYDFLLFIFWWDIEGDFINTYLQSKYYFYWFGEDSGAQLTILSHHI